MNKIFLLILSLVLVGCGPSNQINDVQVNKAIYFCGSNNISMIQNIFSPNVRCSDGRQCNFDEIELPKQ